MLRAGRTERFYVYTAKWNRRRLMNAIVDFGEVELTEQTPDMKPSPDLGGAPRVDEEGYRKLKGLRKELEDLLGRTLGHPTPAEVEVAAMQMGAVDDLVSELDEKMKEFSILKKALENPKLVDETRRELEELNQRLAEMDTEMIELLRPHVETDLGTEESYLGLFGAINQTGEGVHHLVDLIDVVPDSVSDPESLEKLSSDMTKVLESMNAGLGVLGDRVPEDVSSSFEALTKDLNELVPLLDELCQIGGTSAPAGAGGSGEEDLLRRISNASVNLGRSIGRFWKALEEASNAIFSPFWRELSAGLSLEAAIGRYMQPVQELIAEKSRLEEFISLTDRASKEDIKALEQGLEELAKRLRAMLWAVRGDLLRAEVSGLVYEEKGIVSISGWVPVKMKDDLRDHLDRWLKGMVEVRFEREKGGPSYVKLPSLFRSFRMLTHKMIGLPNPGEMDPTPIVSLAFPLVFGVMFGDIGHGLVALLLGLLLFKKKKGGIRDLGGVFIPMGLASMFFGVLYGEVFLREAYHPILVSPVHEPLKMLVVAALFGVFHLNGAFAANMMNRLLKKRYLASLLEYGGLFTILALDSAAYAVYRGGGDVLLSMKDPFFMVAAAFLIVSLIVTAIKHGVMEFISAGIEGTIGLLANTLSYLRLAGFAIAHGVFGVMVDALAGPESGMGAFVIALFSMNLLSMGLEGMVAFIQATRLTLYEFLTKCFTAGGRSLKPIGALIE